MTAGWCTRTVRAAVFAALCVLLAAVGHVLMSGTAVPWWAVAAGTAATGGAAWWLADRERGPLAVVGVAVAAQTALHVTFSLAQATRRQQSGAQSSLADRWLHVLLCRMPSGAGATAGAEQGTMPMPMSTGDHGAHSLHSLHSLRGMNGMEPVDHAMAGMSSAGMLTAHLVAALLCGLWLAHGERAAFRIVRALAARLVAPLRLLLRLPVPPHRPRVRTRRAASERAPRRLLLAHAITSRGPPAGVAVA